MTQAQIEELELSPGDTYGDFEIVRVLGRGGFARVFEARTSKFDHPVALKISRTPLHDEATAIRALREIRVLEQLRSPYVVHILDHGMGPDERWYMVMELLQGQSLLHFHDFARPLAPKLAVRWIYEACVGLDDAHELGIVHRDIKPENMWINMPAQTCKVIDFGLARAWDPGVTIGEQATVGHMLIGTPHYAQPEQVESGKLVPASDIYSLGTVLYELLVAHNPLHPDRPLMEVVSELSGNPVGWLAAHVRKDIVPIEHYPVGAKLPEQLRRIVHWMLRKKPEQRPARGSVVAEHLAWLLHFVFETPVAGLLRSARPDGSNPSRLVLPGKHEFGNRPESDLELEIGGPKRAHATLDWRGPGHEAVLSPVEPIGTATVNGHLLEQPVLLVPGTYFDIAGTRMVLDYP